MTTVQNNVSPAQPPIVSPYSSFLGYTMLAVAEPFQWVYSKLPSFPYTQIKKSVTSIGSMLWDPTSALIETIKLPKVDLTELLLPDLGEDNSFKLKLLRTIFRDIETAMVRLPKIKGLQETITEKMDIAALTVSQPNPPPPSKKMREKMRKNIEKQQQKIEQRQKEHQQKPTLERFANMAIYKFDQLRAREKLQQATIELINGQQEQPRWDKGKEFLHEIIKTLLDQLSVEKNLGNLLSLALKELTKVITSIQDIDLVNSKSVKDDFVKLLTGNVNIDIKTFKKEQKKSLKENLKKIATNIAGRSAANKNKNDTLNTSLTKAAAFFSNVVLKLTPESLLEKVLETVIKGLSNLLVEEMPDLICNMLKQTSIPSFQSCNTLQDVFQIYQNTLKNGTQLGSINIQFPEAALNDQLFLLDNINALIPLIFRTLIAVLVEGLAKHVDWKADPSVPQIEDQDKKMMQKMVNKNFADLVDAILSTLDKKLTGAIGQRLEFRSGSIDLSLAPVAASWALFFGRVLFDIVISSCDEVPLYHAMGNILAMATTDPRAIARKTIYAAEYLVGAEMKRIDIAQILPVFTLWLRRAAQT